MKEIEEVRRRVIYWKEKQEELEKENVQVNSSSTATDDDNTNSTEQNKNGFLEEEAIKDLKYCMEIKNASLIEKDICSLVASIVNALPYLEEPLMVFDQLIKIFRKGGILGASSVLGVITLITEHGGEMEDFFEVFFNLLTLEVLSYAKDKILFLCRYLFKSESISLFTVKSIIKRLSYLSIRADCFTAAEIMCVISKGLILHRKAVTSFANREKRRNTAEYRDFQPYLYEIDALKAHPLLSEYAQMIKSNTPIDTNTSQELKNKISYLKALLDNY